MTGATLIIHIVMLTLILACLTPIIRSEARGDGIFRWHEKDD